MVRRKLSHVLIVVFILSLGLNAYLLSNNKTEKTTIPPVIGKFEPAQPISQKPIGEPLTIRWKTKTEYIEVKSKGEYNTLLLDKYKDSLTTAKEQLQLYLDAITYREFEHTFEDERLLLSLSGETQGELRKIGIDEYIIKERVLDVPKNKPFAISAFAGYGMSKTGLSPMVGIGLSYSFWEF